MLFMKSQSHQKNYLIKKIKVSILQCIWNGESIGIWNQSKKNKKIKNKREKERV